MTDDEALETLFAMANVQDGYAKKATDPGLKVIHKANAKAQREVAAVISDLRAGRDRWATDAKFWENRENEAVKRAEKAEAERDDALSRLAAAEAQVGALVGLPTDYGHDGLRWKIGAAMRRSMDSVDPMTDREAALYHAFRAGLRAALASAQGVKHD